MFSTKKSGVFLLLCVLFLSLVVSNVFGTTGVVAKTSCGPNDIVVYLTGQSNAHASLADESGNSNYNSALCFTSTIDPADTTKQVLRPMNAAGVYDPTQNRACHFGNEVLSLSAQSNAHVEGPAANMYTNNACFGYLDCRLSTTNNPSSGEQLLAQLSATTNAHVSVIGDSSGRFPQYLICKELICSATPTQTVYPLIESFEDAASPIFTAAIASSSSQVAIQQDGSRAYLGTKSAKITYFIPQSPTGALVATFPLSVRNNWAGYDYLEFYLWVDSVLGVDLRITSGVSNQQTTIPISIGVSGSPNGLQKGRWNLIRIPLSMIPSTDSIKEMDFVADPNKYSNLLPGSTVSYGLDAVQLTSNNPNSASSPRYYCAGQLQADGSNKYYWTSSLDNTAASWFSSSAPWVSATPSGKVCGDIPGETFVDGTKGCFDGKLIADGTVFDSLVLPQLSSTDPTATESTYCFGTLGGIQCRITTPPILSTNSISPVAVTSRTQNVVFDSSSALSPGAKVPDTSTYNIAQPRFIYGKQTADVNGVYSQPSATNFFACVVGGLSPQFSTFQNVNPASSASGQRCPTVSGYTCSPSGYFTSKNMSADGNMFVALSAGSQDSEVSGCCPTGQCYANGQCWQDQINLPGSKPIKLYSGDDSAYRCQTGTWKTASAKQSYDGSETGYCPLESQCLVTTNLGSGKPSCIDGGTYYQNYYCDASNGSTGTWTSKTAILASQMINYAKNTLGWSTGTLYCDDYSKALNVLDGSLQVSKIFQGINSAGGKDCAIGASSLTSTGDDSCVNNFCVFAPGSSEPNAKPFIGTSLNKPFENISGLGTIFDGSCANIGYRADKSFVQCGSSDYQYAPNLSLVIYDPNEISIFSSAWNSIRNFFADIFTGTTTKEKYSVISQSQLFTRFYYTLNENPSISAFNERRYSDVVQGAVDYYVFSIKTQTPMKIDICNDVVTPHNLKYVSSPSNWINCSSTSTSALIVGDADGQAQKLWPKLTAQLRLS